MGGVSKRVSIYQNWGDRGFGSENMARLWFAAAGRIDVPVLVPSQRVAALGGQLGFSRVHACAGASADALLDGLSAITKNG